jgi:hypothetical protein
MEEERAEIMNLIDEISQDIDEGQYLRLCTAIKNYDLKHSNDSKMSKLKSELNSYKRSVETLMDMLVELHEIIDEQNESGRTVINPRTGRKVKANSRLGRKIAENTRGLPDHLTFD